MRVVLAEDLFLLRDGLVRMLVDAGFDVVADVESGPALRAALDECRPDIAVVDVRLPPSFTDEGLQEVLAFRRKVPGFPVLVLSQYVEQLYARELLADGSGAVGYLLKDRVFDSEQFIDAVNRVASGGTVLDPHVVSKLVTRVDARGSLSTLTKRELEVLTQMAEGRSNAAIAQVLHLSISAVTKHSASIFAKLDLVASDDDNRRVLAVLAYLDA